MSSLEFDLNTLQTIPAVQQHHQLPSRRGPDRRPGGIRQVRQYGLPAADGGYQPGCPGQEDRRGPSGRPAAGGPENGQTPPGHPAQGQQHRIHRRYQPDHPGRQGCRRHLHRPGHHGNHGAEQQAQGLLPQGPGTAQQGAGDPPGPLRLWRHHRHGAGRSRR